MTHPQGRLFKSIAHRGGWITLGLGLLFLALGSWGAANLPGRPVSGGTFWLAVAAMLGWGLGLFFFYRAYTLFKLTYYIDRNGLEIRWGSMTQRIPISNIANITAIEAAEGISLPEQQFLGLPLPAWWAGRWGNTLFRTTAPPDDSLAAQTADENYIISPRDAREFIRAWQLRIPLGPTQQWRQEVIRHSLWAHPLLRDPLGLRLMSGAILLTLILVGAVMSAYPSWPTAVPIRFDALGQVAGIAGRQQLLWIPGGGLIILLLNLVLGMLWYKKDRLIAYLLWFTTMALQIGLWVGARMIMG